MLSSTMENKTTEKSMCLSCGYGKYTFGMVSGVALNIVENKAREDEQVCIRNFYKNKYKTY